MPSTSTKPVKRSTEQARIDGRTSWYVLYFKKKEVFSMSYHGGLDTWQLDKIQHLQFNSNRPVEIHLVNEDVF
jgi:hypothetical protein